MAGQCTFYLTGRVFYVKDDAPRPGKPWGSISVGLEIPEQFIGTKRFPAHGVFITVKYGQNDIGRPHFEATRASLQKDKYLFVNGELKPRDASPDGKYPATINLEARHNSIKVSDTEFPPKNMVLFSGEVVGVAQPSLRVLYSYVNPKESDPKKKWKERSYAFVMQPNNLAGKSAKEPITIQGRIFAISPTDLKTKMIWLYADEVY